MLISPWYVPGLPHGPSSHGAYFLMSEAEIITVVPPRVCVLKKDRFLGQFSKRWPTLGDRAGFLEKCDWAEIWGGRFPTVCRQICTCADLVVGMQEAGERKETAWEETGGQGMVMGYCVGHIEGSVLYPRKNGNPLKDFPGQGWGMGVGRSVNMIGWFWSQRGYGSKQAWDTAQWTTTSSLSKYRKWTSLSSKFSHHAKIKSYLLSSTNKASVAFLGFQPLLMCAHARPCVSWDLTFTLCFFCHAALFVPLVSFSFPVRQLPHHLTTSSEKPFQNVPHSTPRKKQ